MSLLNELLNIETNFSIESSSIELKISSKNSILVPPTLILKIEKRLKDIDKLT